jgi:hypothetical protein
MTFLCQSINDIFQRYNWKVKILFRDEFNYQYNKSNIIIIIIIMIRTLQRKKKLIIYF